MLEPSFIVCYFYLLSRQTRPIDLPVLSDSWMPRLFDRSFITFMLNSNFYFVRNGVQWQLELLRRWLIGHCAVNWLLEIVSSVALFLLNLWWIMSNWPFSFSIQILPPATLFQFVFCLSEAAAGLVSKFWNLIFKAWDCSWLKFRLVLHHRQQMKKFNKCRRFTDAGWMRQNLNVFLHLTGCV